jgi:hypothetical protein
MKETMFKFGNLTVFPLKILRLCFFVKEFLLHFHLLFCPFLLLFKEGLLCWTSFRDSYFLYLIATSALFVQCGGCKKIAPYIHSEMLYFLSLKIVQHGIIVVLVIIKFFLLGFFLVGWLQYSSIEYCWITVRIFGLLIKFCLLTSVICRLHNLWSRSILFSSPIVFSFRSQAFFYLGTICRFSLNGTYVPHWTIHYNRYMNTSAGNCTNLC